MMANLKTVVSVLGLLLLAATASAEVLVGKGRWQSLAGESMQGPWSLRVETDGAQLAGVLTLGGSNILKEARVQGVLDAQLVTLGVVVEGSRQATFSGKLDGKSITGEWVMDAIGDRGVWYGELDRSIEVRD